MSERQLLIDQGNSRLKWVWAVAGALDLESANRGSLKEFKDDCRKKAEFPPARIVLSSVGSAAAAGRLAEQCRSYWDVEVKQLKSRQSQGGVRNAYRNPSSLGVDRWLAMVGAVQHYGAPLVVWDLGTASTLDAVDAAGQHRGGWIFPGPQTMLESLGRNTGLAVPGAPESLALKLGQATSECIVSGVLGAQLGALDRFLGLLADDSGQTARLVVTGGGAAPVLPHLDREHIHDPWLVFRGMLVD